MYSSEFLTTGDPNYQPPTTNNYGVLEKEVENSSLPLSNEGLSFEGSEEPELIDPNNGVFNSFIGVNRIPLGILNIEKDPLAGGAFGQVYRGSWGERPIALKKIDFQYAKRNLGIGKEEILESLSWEISRLSTVTHPNIVPFYGIYQHVKESYTFLVMEFCEGGELRKKLKKEPNLPWSKRWQWALDITRALAYLHNEGVLHRDLKAENILLDRNDRAKLADLGVAQVDALLQESEALVVATGLQDKRFIAPENVRNQTLSSKATDIYALGLVFWEIASGKEPGTSNMNLEWQKGSQIEREPIPTDCPDPFKELILNCWQYEDKKRPSAEQLTTLLNQIGPQLHERCALIQNCQYLDKLIHPKRKEGLSYIPPFVTEYKVEEAIESYWSRFESPKPGEELKNPPLKLDEIFNKFLNTTGSNTLLLLGEAGLGKTLTTYLWADQLLSKWWAHINQGAPAPAYFPLFIRPSVPKWTHKAINGAILEIVQRYNLPRDIPLLVFVDGYDELQLDTQPSNLVNHLGLNQEAHAKLIVSCRPNIVEQSDARFSFNGQLQTYHFLPFSVDQLLTYLKKELSWEEKLHDEYKKTLEDAKAVRTVLRNPFVLYLMRLSWETVSKKPLNQLNRWQIYEGFIEHVIETRKSLLSENLQKTLQSNYPSLLTSYQAFASDIALSAFNKSSITLGWKEKTRGSEWVALKEHVEHEAKEEFIKRQEILSAKLKKANEKEKEQITRRSLLQEKDYVLMMDKRRQQFESELPMKLRGEETEKSYEYSHKSLFEYFMAKRLIMLKSSNSIIEDGIQLLQKRPIQAEKEALTFWEEGWGVEEVNQLKEPLFEIIKASRHDINNSQASANAATLLAAAHVPFSGRDLSKVQIPGAELRNAILDNTCFYQANLQGVALHSAWLGNTDLRGANMTGIYFGEYPSLLLKSEANCVSYSPDHSQMAVGLDNGKIRLYNKEEDTYKFITTLNGHRETVCSVTYSPDGKQLASGSKDSTVKIWDTTSHKQVTQRTGRITHDGWVYSVCYSPDSKYLATGSYDNTIGIWDISSLQRVAQLKGHTQGVLSVTYSPDGKHLASGSSDTTVRIWDTTSHQQVTQLKGHSWNVNSVRYSPNGKQIVTAGDAWGKGELYLWDANSYQQVAQLKWHTLGINSVCYSPDGKHLVSGSKDNTVGIWDTSSHQLVAHLKGHKESVLSVSYSPNGKHLASGSSDKTVGIWETASHQPVTQLKGHTSDIRSISYSPNGKQLASGGGEWGSSELYLWDTDSLQQVAQLKGLHTGWINSVCYSPDGKHLATGSKDSTVGIWDTASHQQVTQLNVDKGWVNSIQYTPNGKQLAIGCAGKTVIIWDTASHQEVSQFKEITDCVNCISCSPDGKYLAFGSNDTTVSIWDMASHQQVTNLKDHKKIIYCISYSPDGKYLATGGGDEGGIGELYLWDSTSHQKVTQLSHKDCVKSVTYSPNGKHLATGSYDNTIRIWDTSSHQVTQLKGHSDRVFNVTYGPDGKHLASSSKESIFLWVQQRASCFPGDQETWQLIGRLETSHNLLAYGAFLKGAIISDNNRDLLKQKGANNDQDLPDHPE